MNSALADLGWTEEQWNRISSTVTEEAQKARVAAQILPVCGPEDPTTIAVPNFTLEHHPNPETPIHDPDNQNPWHVAEPPERLEVDSYPTLWITRIAVNVGLHSHEVADPELKAALVMFRRAANHIARLEDVIIFNGRPGNHQLPQQPGQRLLRAMPPVFTVRGRGPVAGIFTPLPNVPDGRIYLNAPPPGGNQGQELVSVIVDAIDQLEARAQLGPYACILSHSLFEAVCSPTQNLVLPRDRILPFLQGPLMRTSTILDGWGVVIAMSGSPVEVVVASDINVNFLQTTLEPRFVFRVSERVALRIKEDSAIAVIMPRE
jgi:uncharacterized linocin/CFP29 family protein